MLATRFMKYSLIFAAALIITAGSISSAAETQHGDAMEDLDR